MQTFLPFPSYVDSARCLDNKRLGKQRVEVLQILNALVVPGAGWSNHPAVKMWRGYTPSLAHYGLVVCQVWRQERGFKDTCFGKIRAHFPDWTIKQIQQAPKPFWFGDKKFHMSHRSNLVRKDPAFYMHKFEWMLPTDIDYVWPV